MDNLYLFVFWFTILNKIILIVLFLLQSKNKRFNLLFAAIIASALPVIGSNLMHFLQIDWFIERVFIASAIGSFFYPLCLILFHETLQISLNRKWKFKVYMWLPFAYYILLMFWYVFFAQQIDKNQFVESNLNYNWNDSYIVDLVNVPLNIIFIGHIIYFIFFLSKVNRITKLKEAPVLRNRYRFVRSFIYSLIGVSIVLIITTTLGFDNKFFDAVIVPMSSNVLIILIVYFVLDGRLVSEERPVEFHIKEEELSITPRKEILSITQVEKICLKVEEYFIKNEEYLQTDFGLQKLSDELSEKTHHISYAINTKHEKSFSDLLGKYRVERAKKILESDTFKALTIEAIGQSVGYKSKSTFFSQFKKNTGITPLVYRNRL